MGNRRKDMIKTHVRKKGSEVCDFQGTIIPSQAVIQILVCLSESPPSQSNMDSRIQNYILIKLVQKPTSHINKNEDTVSKDKSLQKIKRSCSQENYFYRKRNGNLCNLEFTLNQQFPVCPQTACKGLSQQCGITGPACCTLDVYECWTHIQEICPKL